MVTAPTNITDDTGTVVCFVSTMTCTNGIWQGLNPLSFSLPLLIVQNLVIVLVTRVVALLLKPFHQPRLLAEIIGGIVLGPSVAGQMAVFRDVVFPPRSILTLQGLGHLGLLYFLFLVGVEMDIAVIGRTGHKALVVAAASMVIPFSIGTASSFLLRNFISKNIHEGAFVLFLGVALSVTAFPLLARILAETKLLNSEIGRISMSAAIINDLCAWILLAISVALTGPSGTALTPLWVLLSGVGFVLLCLFCIRPTMWWFMQKLPEGQAVSDFHVCLLLGTMMLAAVMSDVIGFHSAFGAFVFGLVLPNGPVGVAFIARLEDIVSGLLLPLYLVSNGLSTDLSKVRDGRTVALLVLVFVLASIGKIAGTVVISLFYTMPLREGLSLGFLMNTRGLVEIIVLNIGRDMEVLDDESFAVMVMTSLVMTLMVTPLVTYLHRPLRRLVGYKRRNLQRSKPDTELRVLACVHNTRNVPSIVSVLNISNPSKRSPIFVYALHLVELTGRASAMLIVHHTKTSKVNNNRKPVASLIGRQVQSEHIFHAFDNYEQRVGGVSVQTLTVVSPYTTMHEDICSLAEDKHVTLIILPFHKQQTVDGGMEPINSSIKVLNANVLNASPCSVGILIDRGLSSKARMAHGQQYSHRIALLFFGGPDDREALAYAWRMAENPSINLTVVRFIAGDQADVPQSPATTPPPPTAQDSRTISIVTDSTQEKQLDEEYLNEFLLGNIGNESLLYTEKVVNSTEETVAAIQSMESVHDLYVVGRSQRDAALTLTAGLTEWAECPELGPIGDLLASSDFATTISVLVVHQYTGGPLGRTGSTTTEGSTRPMQRRNGNESQRLSTASRARQAMPPELSVRRNGR
ncbi:cation/H(+) antiporter 15-like [Musa acuminata AAA Group]|uniref:cation/H(+) antiporter 15-like n=1 Tax=Musa acuminata AAA Group TaxID=214697 RepID=UPI0031CF1045